MRTTENVTATVTRADGNPPPPWSESRGRWDGSAWTVTLHYQGRDMTVPFWQGSGCKDAPTVGDVLECVLSDAAMIKNDELNDVLGGMPYSEARKVADACESQTDALRVLLGDDFDFYVFPPFESDES